MRKTYAIFWELLQSIRRRQLNSDQEAYQLVERVRAEMLSSNTVEEGKAQESSPSWIYVLHQMKRYFCPPFVSCNITHSLVIPFYCNWALLLILLWKDGSDFTLCKVCLTSLACCKLPCCLGQSVLCIWWYPCCLPFALAYQSSKEISD